MAAVRYQLARLSHGRRTAPNVSPLWALIVSQMHARRSARQYRRWMAERKAAVLSRPLARPSKKAVAHG